MIMCYQAREPDRERKGREKQKDKVNMDLSQKIISLFCFTKPQIKQISTYFLRHTAQAIPSRALRPQNDHELLIIFAVIVITICLPGHVTLLSG